MKDKKCNKYVNTYECNENHCNRCEYRIKTCSNYYWFNGDEGDGQQFCDNLESFVNENFYCNRFLRRK